MREISVDLKKGTFRFGDGHKFTKWGNWAGTLPTGSSRFGRSRKCIHCGGEDIKAGGAGSRWVDERLQDICWDNPNEDSKGYVGSIHDIICEWNYDPKLDCWVPACGIAKWSLIDGTPFDNDMKFCPFCGKKICEVEDEHYPVDGNYPVIGS